MRLIQNYTFRITGKLPYSEWPGIVHRFLEEQGLSCGTFLYFFQDFDRKSCDRIVKNCPRLGEPEYVEGSAYGMGNHWMLSNIHRPTDCTEADLLPLMKRIHRSYGFPQADLFYLDVDFFGRVVPMERDLEDVHARAERFHLPPEERLFLDHQPRGSGFRLHRDILGNNDLTMSIELLRDGQLLDPTPYYEAMQALLPGMRCQTYPQLILTQEEQAELDAQAQSAAPLFEEIREFLGARLPGHQRQNRTASRYKLAPTLKPLCKQYGWSYRFLGDGAFCMDKQTGKGQLLRLNADSGPSRYETCFYLEFIGVGYCHGLYTSIFTPKNQAEFDDAAARVFAAMSEFETAYLSRLTAHFPAAPEWYGSDL